jgi:predicted nuclease of predicted toxin-antitoxin system
VPERYLADENFPRAGVRRLAATGLDIVHFGDILPGAEDELVAQEAERIDAVLLTFDRDFGDLAVRHHVAVPGVVLFRLGQRPPDVILAFLDTFFAARPVLRGYFTVATPGQMRQRPLPQHRGRVV